MISSEFRAEARRHLDGKWGKAVCIILANILISFGIGLVLGILNLLLPRFLINIGQIVIEIPISFGLIRAFVKLYNGEDVGAFDFLALGFGEFSKSWGIAFRTIGKLIVPFILMIVGLIITIAAGATSATVSIVGRSSYSYAPVASSVSKGSLVVAIIGFILYLVCLIWFIVKSYYYQLSYIVAADDETISAKDAVDQSRKLMDGKRGKLFVLQLSFIGWAILGALSFGIGMLWVIPYVQCAIIAFYKFVSGNNNTAKVVEEAPTEEPVTEIEEPKIEE